MSLVRAPRAVLAAAAVAAGSANALLFPARSADGATAMATAAATATPTPTPTPRAGTAVPAATSALAAPRGSGRLEVVVTDAAGRPLPDAVLWVPRGAATPLPAPPREPVPVEQRDRDFIPRVTVVQVGARVAFPNRDQMLHHVYSFSPAKRFELKLYEGDPPEPVTMDRPGVVSVGCNIHDWMRAHVVVVDTPHFARTDAHGRAVLTALPRGEHELRAWHPAQKADNAPRAVPVGAGANEMRVSIDVYTPRPRVKPPLDPNAYGG